MPRAQQSQHSRKSSPPTKGRNESQDWPWLNNRRTPWLNHFLQIFWRFLKEAELAQWREHSPSMRLLKKKNHNLRCFVFSTLTTQLLDFFDATNSFRMSTDDSIKFISKSPSVQIVGVTWSRIACRLGCFMSAFFATSDYPTQIDSFDKEKRHPLSTDYWTPNFQEKSAPPPYPLVSCL